MAFPTHPSARLQRCKAAGRGFGEASSALSGAIARVRITAHFDVLIFFVYWMYLGHLVGVKEGFFPPFLSFGFVFLLAVFLFIFTSIFCFCLEVQGVSEMMETHSHLSGYCGAASAGSGTAGMCCSHRSCSPGRVSATWKNFYLGTLVTVGITSCHPSR